MSGTSLPESAPRQSTEPSDGEVVETPLQSGAEKMAQNNPSFMQHLFAMTGQVSGNPITNKMNEAHITQVLNLSEAHDKREFDLSQAQQKIDAEAAKREVHMYMVCVIILVLLLMFIILVFKSQPTVLTPILSGIGGTVVGAFGGWGFAKSKQQK